MRRRRLVIALTFILVVSTLFYTFLFVSDEAFNYSRHVDQVKLLENKLQGLAKSNNLLIDTVKSHLKNVHKHATDRNVPNNSKSSLQYSNVVFDDINIDIRLGKHNQQQLSSPLTNFSKSDALMVQQFIPKVKLEDERPVIAVLVISCNRVTVRRCLDQLLRIRTSPDQFPIIVSQDCSHRPTTDVILSYGDQVALIKQPDQSDIQVPPKEKKFKGYFKIARHYKWALNQTFNVFGFEAAIIVEDDLDIAPDFYQYFLGTYWLLKADSTLWCVSAWNDNGHAELVNENQPELLYRTDFFPGLGWMLTKSLWDELSSKWPRSYWDDWIRKPEQRNNRACIRPEVSRTKTFGKIGVSNGMFYEKHLKYIKLNENYVDFTRENLSYLLKDTYDKFVDEVYQIPVVSHFELKMGKIVAGGPVRIPYYNKDQFKKAAKSLGLMDDFKSGVPRTAYRGIVSFYYEGRRVYLAPQMNWPGYNITWS